MDLPLVCYLACVVDFFYSDVSNVLRCVVLLPVHPNLNCDSVKILLVKSKAHKLSFKCICISSFLFYFILFYFILFYFIYLFFFLS